MIRLTPADDLLAAELKSSERGWLRQRSDLLDPSCPVWRSIADAEVGLRALRVLSAS